MTAMTAPYRWTVAAIADVSPGGTATIPRIKTPPSTAPDGSQYLFRFINLTIAFNNNCRTYGKSQSIEEGTETWFLSLITEMVLVNRLCATSQAQSDQN